jgi:hypothetical protein
MRKKKQNEAGASLERRIKGRIERRVKSGEGMR